MGFLHRNIKVIIIALSLLLSIFISLYFTNTVFDRELRTTKLTQTYGLLSITFLYLTIIIPDLLSLSRRGIKPELIREINISLGISTLYFAVQHFSTAFFGYLGGFAGWGFLSTKYQLSVLLGLSGLISIFISIICVILFSNRKRKKQENFNKIIYLGLFLLIIHVLMLGSHFKDLSKNIPLIFTFALIILIFLEALRLNNYIRKINHKNEFVYRILLSIATVLLSGFAYYLLALEGVNNLGIRIIK